MGNRAELEHQVAMAEKRLKEAPKDTPEDLLRIWEDEYVGLSLELNNYDDATSEEIDDK